MEGKAGSEKLALATLGAQTVSLLFPLSPPFFRQLTAVTGNGNGNTNSTPKHPCHPSLRSG
jgi:hypothetical protein